MVQSIEGLIFLFLHYNALNGWLSFWIIHFCCFCKYVHFAFVLLHHLFIAKSILVSIFFTMSTIAMKEGRVLIVVDYLYFGIKDVAFEINVLNMYGTFDQNVNDHGKSKLHILHYDLLNRTCLTTITLSVKSPHIKCMNNFYTRACMWRWNFFCIEPKANKGF